MAKAKKSARVTLGTEEIAIVDGLIAAVRGATGAKLKRTQVLRALVAVLESRKIDPRLIRSEEDLAAAFAGLDPKVVSTLLKQDSNRLDPDTLEALKNSLK